MILIVIFVFLLLLLIIILFFNIIFTVLEHNYGLLFNKPFFVHCYHTKERLTERQLSILQHKFPFFKTLSEEQKLYFEHRIIKFIDQYEFIGKEDFVVTEEVKVLIAATSIMLTFGMRKYLYKVIDKIIIFPNEYYSTINDAYHKGEFNPRYKAIVFSWSDFVAGFDTASDNLNLGIHEFTHVLHYNALKSDDASATIFTRWFTQINKEVNHPPNRDRLIDSNYFRVYAYTNAFEFLAVIIEHFFESPEDFKQEFPELYKKVALMLNYKVK